MEKGEKTFAGVGEQINRKMKILAIEKGLKFKEIWELAGREYLERNGISIENEPSVAPAEQQ